MKKSSGRIVKIIKGLKNISRKNDENVKIEMELSVLLEEVFSVCVNKKEHITIELGPVPDVMISICEDKVSQILINLINNSIDAIEDCLFKWVKIESEINQSKDKVIIKVIDSGMGISKEVSDKMMNAFFTTKSIGSGTGLGLSISKKIAEEHNGKLYFDSEAKNTTFILELPIIS